MAAMETSAQAWAVIITALATLLTAAGGILALFVRQGRLHAENISKIERVYETVNSVEEHERVPGEKRTLGQTVQDIHAEQVAGFKLNEDEHARLHSHIDAVQDVAHAISQRVDVIRSDLDVVADTVNGD